jgi:hypothetical protein
MSDQTLHVEAYLGDSQSIVVGLLLFASRVTAPDPNSRLGLLKS